jgi:hypothetical protein
MLDAPDGMLVSPNVKRRVLDARAKRLHPEAYAQWEQDMLYREHVNSLRKHCAMCLISMGADSDKVAQVVLGPTSNLVGSTV